MARLRRLSPQATDSAAAPSDAAKPSSPAARDTSLSIVKAASILRAVSSDDAGLTLTAVVAKVGLPTTVCHRMLATLEREGLVGRDADTGRYRLGTEVMALARRAQKQHPISLQTASLMAHLARETHDVALLMVLDRGEAICIDRLDGDYPVVGNGTQIGNRLPLHCGGGPFALLAFSPPAVIEATLAQPLRACTAKTLTDPAKVRRRIAESRKRGYTIGDEDLFDYVVAVGAPIYGPGERLLGAISVGGIKPRYDAKRIAEVGQLLRDGAKRLSSSLR